MPFKDIPPLTLPTIRDPRVIMLLAQPVENSPLVFAELMNNVGNIEEEREAFERYPSDGKIELLTLFETPFVRSDHQVVALCKAYAKSALVNGRYVRSLDILKRVTEQAVTHLITHQEELSRAHGEMLVINMVDGQINVSKVRRFRALLCAPLSQAHPPTLLSVITSVLIGHGKPKVGKIRIPMIYLHYLREIEKYRQPLKEKKQPKRKPKIRLAS